MWWNFSANQTIHDLVWLMFGQTSLERLLGKENAKKKWNELFHELKLAYVVCANL